jgi:hypothetical protein
MLAWVVRPGFRCAVLTFVCVIPLCVGLRCVCLSGTTAKYYYFTRVMGRESSQIAMECALQTHPNMVGVLQSPDASETLSPHHTGPRVVGWQRVDSRQHASACSLAKRAP